MQAVIKAGGQQFVVKQGQRIKINKLEAAEGSAVNFDVLMITGATNKIGTPLVAGAKVVGKILNPLLKGPKIVVSTYKRRKGYHKTKGHRHQFTEVLIESISA